jgi:hypothetical protein
VNYTTNYTAVRELVRRQVAEKSSGPSLMERIDESLRRGACRGWIRWTRRRFRRPQVHDLAPWRYRTPHCRRAAGEVPR